jgi:preprotein translocase subunit SecD
MAKQRWLLALIFLVMIGSVLVISRIPVKLGLDLQGGAQLTLEVKTTDKVTEITPKVLSAVQRVVENRINGLGVSEALVQTAGENKLLLQLPGVNDPAQAERVLKGTAQLDFRFQKPGTEAQLGIEQRFLSELVTQKAEFEKSKDIDGLAKTQASLQKTNTAIAAFYEKTGLTGALLREALATPTGPQSWSVAVRFDAQGGELFANLTKRVAGTGRTLGIFLDDQLISAPTVDVKYSQTGITGGSAEIFGNFTAQTANDLAVQLQGGALPVPLEVIENRTVGASLGQDSIRSSIYAGLGGLALVLLFMAVYYRLPGIIADLALTLYALLTFAIFVLLGVTLTLPGIAGFILSIGMAVDANVLIFERTREELRSGKSLYRSVESGFYRAFSSILDSNVTTLIACGALFWLGAGLVRGFALTLAIGVMVSMFTAVTCSRTLMLFALSFPGLRKPQFFCPKLEGLR